MKAIYTEIRITHKTIEDKKAYEEKLDVQLAVKGYTNRSVFVREKIRDLVEEDIK